MAEHRSTHSHSSHRHSHSRSHSHSRRTSSSDIKAYRKTRYFFAFLLFIALTLFSLSAAAKAGPLNDGNVSKVFTNREYVLALSEDVRTYGEDMCRRNGVPVKALGDLLSYESVREINEAYIYGTLSLNEKYTATSYTDKLDALSASLEKSISSTLKAENIRTADGMDDGAAALSADITGYFESRMVFPYMDKVETLLNLGSTAAWTVLVVSAVLSVALILVVIALGSELYRNLRSVAHAFSASALMCFVIAAAYGLVDAANDLVIFPEYLSASIMSYLNSSIGAVLLTGGILTILSFAVMAAIWTLKSDELDATTPNKSVNNAY